MGTPPSTKPPGRNDPCPCGSGRTFDWQNRRVDAHQRVDVAELRRKLGL